MSRFHTVFLVLAPLKAGELGAVRRMLADHAYLYPSCGNDPFGFGEIESLHFASLFIYDDPKDGPALGLEANVDGDAASFLKRLAAGKTAFLIELYAHCDGFSEASEAGLVAYWTKRLHRPQAAHVAGFNLSRPRILADGDVRRVVVDVLGDGRTKLPLDVAGARILETLDSDPRTAGTWNRIEDEGTKIGAARKLVLGVGLGLVGLAYLLVLAPLMLIFERTARQDEERPDLPLVQSQKANEDLIPTNHMVSVVHLPDAAAQPGERRVAAWLRRLGAVSRRLTKRVTFLLLRMLAALVYRDGRLGKIGSIHFAHWALANGGRRLIFVSNFVGSWDSYLDDFTLKASRGLTLAWGHGVGFPKSWLSILGGAAQGPEFIDWARRSMVPTLVWYHGYPHLSASQIIKNRHLRERLQRLQENRGSSADWATFI